MPRCQPSEEEIALAFDILRHPNGDPKTDEILAEILLGLRGEEQVEELVKELREMGNGEKARTIEGFYLAKVVESGPPLSPPER